MLPDKDREAFLTFKERIIAHNREELDLSKYSLDAAKKKSLAEALEINTNVKQLCLSYSGDKEDVNLVVEILTTNKTLTKLELYNNSLWFNGMQYDHMQAFAKALKLNTATALLEFRWPEDPDRDFPKCLWDPDQSALEEIEKEIKKYLSRNVSNQQETPTNTQKGYLCFSNASKIQATSLLQKLKGNSNGLATKSLKCFGR